MVNNQRKLWQRIFFYSFIGVAIAAAVIIVSLAAVNFYTLNSQIDRIDWNIPATVYAQPPVLTPGQQVAQEWLTQYLKRLNYVAAKSETVRPGEYISEDNKIMLGLRSFEGIAPRTALVTFNSNRILEIQDASGGRIESLTLEPTPLATLFGSEWEKRTPVKLRNVPRPLIDAVLSTEDRHFYQHHGIDFISIVRAALNNFFDQGPLQGGSTITQQLVKNLYLSPERTLHRKVNEAMLAILMEAKYSKDHILEMYLNEVYLGQNGPISIRGIGEASRLYFKKDARLLTVPEAAMLAGLIQAPGRYDPYRSPDKTLDRRNTVLASMKETGTLTAAQYDQYIRVPVEVKEPEKRTDQAPYFLTFVKRQLKDQFSPRSLHAEDYKIVSTLDYDMQLAAQETLGEGLARVEKMRGRTSRPIQGSLIAIEPSTGKIRAFVGGRNFVKSQFDRVTQAHRQPGSSFKPFVYAAALESAFESGTRYYTPATLVIDEPWSVQISKAVWEPKNYNGEYYGVVSLRTALAKSLNIATAKIAYDVGLDKITAVAQRMGFNNVKPYPSMALGSFEVTPYELVRAYTAFANGGKLVDLQSIERVSNSKGDIVREHEALAYPVLHEQTAYLITDMLKTVTTSGTATSIQQYGFRQHFAGKTGTTNDFKDAWFVGYSPDLICLVWVGYDDNTPLKMTGAQAALPIWAKFMQKIQSRLSARDFPRPQGIVERMIDPYTGKLASDECPSSERELFIAGTEPLQSCTIEDYSLPIESFAGPEPRIQQATFYTNPNPAYGNITYDSQHYSYTNYNNEESQDEMIDYSDQDFNEEDSDSPPTYENDSIPTSQKVEGDQQQTEEKDQRQFEDSYHSSVLNDYEAVRAPYDSSPQDESSVKENAQSQTEQHASRKYVAPVNTTSKHVYTNEDIEHTQTTETDPN